MKFSLRFLIAVFLFLGIDWGYAAENPVKAVQKSGVISQDDYPISALVRLEEGSVVASFTIQPSGNVANCTIESSSGSSELDKHTCKIISERFKYEPARNGKGQPIAEQKSQRVHWRIPQPPSLPELKSFANEMTMTVSPSGAVTSCKATKDGMDIPSSENDNICRMALKFAFKPNADGRTRKVVLRNVATVETVE